MLHKYIKKALFSLSLFMAMTVTQTSQSAPVIFGRVEEKEKAPLYRALMGPSVNYEEINAAYPEAQVAFVPDTTYGIFLYTFRQKHNDPWQRLSSCVEAVNVGDWQTSNPDSEIYKPEFVKDFFNINAALCSLAKNPQDLNLYAKKTLSNDEFLSKHMTLELYTRVTSLEEEAFSKRRLILWKYTHGGGDSIFPLDRILDETKDVPSLYKSPRDVEIGQTLGLFQGGISYAVRLFDGCLRKPADSEKLYPNQNSNISPLRFLAQDIAELKELEKRKQSPEIAGLKRGFLPHSLYCLSVPLDEIALMPEYFYDAGLVNLPHLGPSLERADPSLFLHRIFVQKKGRGKSDLTTGTWISYFSSNETPLDRQKLVETWHKWMARYLHVVCRGTEVVNEGRTSAHDAYETFYDNHIKGVLERLA